VQELAGGLLNGPVIRRITGPFKDVSLIGMTDNAARDARSRVSV